MASLLSGLRTALSTMLGVEWGWGGGRAILKSGIIQSMHRKNCNILRQKFRISHFTKKYRKLSLESVKGTLVCSMRAETGRQSTENKTALFDLSWEQASQAILLTIILCTCLSKNDCESATSSDFGVTNFSKGANLQIWNLQNMRINCTCL